MAIPIEEGFQRAAELGGQVLVPDGAEERDRRCVSFQLRDATRTAGEVPLEIGVDLRRELMLDEIRQEAHEIIATFHC